MNRQPVYNQNNDFKFPTPLTDSISTISVNGSPTAPTTMLLAGCWDNSVTCYELQRNNNQSLSNVVLQGQIKHDAPVLCTDIASDGLTTFSAGCDGQIRMWNVTQGPQSVQVIGKHDQPVRSVKFNPEKNVLISSGWDKQTKIWDCRQPNPVQIFTFPERIYAMDCKGDALVIGTADKSLHIYNLQAMNCLASYKSPLQYQLRTVSIFTDREGFAAGCIEGRVAIEYFGEMESRVRQSTNGVKPTNLKSFAFKCHRQDSDIFAVNAIDFHKNNSLVTAGSDGTFTFWNKDLKQRLSTYELYKLKTPITAAKFSPMGDMLFYSLSYDWSKGATGNGTQYPNALMVHPVQEQELVPKQSAR